MEKDGYSFKSETDSEVIANLMQQNFEQTSDVKETIVKTVSKLKGHFAFVAMFENGVLAAARYHEPMIIGVGKMNIFCQVMYLVLLNRLMMQFTLIMEILFY